MDACPVPHEHVWRPMLAVTGCYECDCGANGYRHYYTGEIRAYKHKSRTPRTPVSTVGVSPQARATGTSRLGRRAPGAY